MRRRRQRHPENGDGDRVEDAVVDGWSDADGDGDDEMESAKQ